MEMHQIRYFLAVARTLNFTQAAAECNVSQPALSRAVKQLEEELGGDLFRRERSLSHMTELGRMMLPLLTQAYDTASSAKALASSFRKGTHAPLRLALSNTIDLKLLIDPLSQLMEALPGVELKFLRGDSDRVGEALKSGDFELAVAGPLSSSWDRFRAWPLFDVGFHLVMHREHALAARNSVAMSQLAGERLLSRPYCEMAVPLSAMLAANGIHATTSDTVASDQDLLALLESNVGIAIMSSLTPCSAALRTVPVEGLDLTCSVSLYAVAGRQYSPAASGLIQLLRAANWSERLAAPAGSGATG
jgi:DNA-binding transcriptional LysR family regulator